MTSEVDAAKKEPKESAISSTVSLKADYGTGKNTPKEKGRKREKKKEATKKKDPVDRQGWKPRKETPHGRRP